MSAVHIYHNPRCSKSRQTLALLQENGITPEICLYLESPPSADQLAILAAQLGMTPRQFLRKGEAEYKAHGLGDEGLADSEVLAIMAANPKLIERPIVVKDGRAVLGRPPENVLGLISAPVQSG
ncbi:MAG: arsenate reductase (glutaredoxin) [Halieaceae bacterium]|nr:arsenate reductase (glutaredoxin) [Halieaceae bacterium]